MATRKNSKVVKTIDITPSNGKIKDETHIDPQPAKEVKPFTMVQDLQDNVNKAKIAAASLNKTRLELFVKWAIIGSVCLDLFRSWKENKKDYQKTFADNNDGKKLLMRPQNAQDREDPNKAFFWDVLGLSEIGYNSAKRYANYFDNKALEYFVSEDDNGEFTVLENAPNDVTSLEQAEKYTPSIDGEEPMKARTAEYHTINFGDDADKITVRGYAYKPSTSSKGECMPFDSASKMQKRLVVQIFQKEGADNFVKAFGLGDTMQLLNALESRQKELNAERIAETNARKTTKGRKAVKRISAEKIAMQDMATAE